MNTYADARFPRALRRVSAEVASHPSAATSSQAARLAALGGDPFRSEAPAPLWDDALLGRLTVPLSRLRE